MSPRVDQKEKLARLFEGCLLQMWASNEWLERRIMPLCAIQLRWTLGSGCWSVAASLDHLNRTFGYYLPRIQEALEEARSTKNREHKPRYTEAEEMFVRQVEPPIVAPMRAPSAVLPSLAVDPDEVVEQFPLLRTQFATIVRSLTEVDGDVSVPDTLHPPVQSLGGLIGLLAAHERRHLWQVQQVLNSSEFRACSAKPPLDDCSGF